MALRSTIFCATLFAVGGATDRAYPQGSDGNSGANQFGSCTVEQTTLLDIDDSLDGDAYSETYMLNPEDCQNYTDTESVLTQMGLYEDGSTLYTSQVPSGGYYAESDDDYIDYPFPASAGHVYSVDGSSFIGYPGSEYYYDQEYFWTYLGTIFASVTTAPPPPHVDSTNPTGGNIGDQGQNITFTGTNLIGQNGASPTLNVEAPTGLSLNFTSVSQDGSTVQATYSISQNTTPTNALIVLSTPSGQSNDIGFNIGYANPSIATLSSYNWDPGSSFALIITGSGFGPSPSVSVSAPDGLVTTSGQPYNTSPDGTSTTININVDPSAAADDPVTVVITAGYTGIGQGFQCGSACAGPNAGGSATASATVTGVTNPSCPTSVSIKHIWQQPLSNDYPAIQTGVGILSEMQVGPVGSNFAGTVIYETVTPTSNSCPANIPSNSVFFNSGFIVGSPAAWENTPYPSEQNAFYDQHIRKAPVSLLSGSNMTTCQATAVQTYTCNGNPIGSSFNLTYTFYTGFIQSTPVTFVSVSKQ